MPAQRKTNDFRIYNPETIGSMMDQDWGFCTKCNRVRPSVTCEMLFVFSEQTDHPQCPVCKNNSIISILEACLQERIVHPDTYCLDEIINMVVPENNS